VHQGRYGHPVGFGRGFGPSLMTLAGEKGAKRLFQGAAVKELAVDDAGVLWDVDVPSALVFK
jgi:molybdenum cofactor cytidylyltransferase